MAVPDHSCALFLNSQISAETQADPTGVWLTQAGGAKIKISKCGAGLCGTIIWLKTPIDASSGKPQVDDRNANRALANRPIIGINIFSGMKPTAGNTWSGTIYNADDGKPYSSDVIIAGPNSKSEVVFWPYCAVVRHGQSLETRGWRRPPIDKPTPHRRQQSSQSQQTPQDQQP
jgi:uncharacterized protein (DUF2147 family)